MLFLWRRAHLWFLRKRLIGQPVRLLDAATGHRVGLGQVSHLTPAWPHVIAEIRWARTSPAATLGFRFVTTTTEHKNLLWNEDQNMLETNVIE